MRIIETEADIAEAAAALGAVDSRMAEAVATAGLPPLRRKPPGFAGLFRIVVGQQVSTASAAAIWSRIEGGGLTAPAAVLGAGEEGMRRAGLSRPKARYAVLIAEAVESGAFSFERHAAMPDAEAFASMTALKGVGRWTAEAYQLICEGRPDVFPAGDLALQEGARRLSRLDERPSEATLAEMAEAWRPWRAVAARVIWAYYAATGKSGGGTPV